MKYVVPLAGCPPAFAGQILARAIDLIGRGVPLANVAADLGYATPAAFSSMFKSAMGYPPSRQRPSARIR
jgi:AraC-like DNA-binding protein